MITQLRTLGRSVAKPAKAGKAMRRLHTDVKVEAKSGKGAAVEVSEVPVITRTFSELLEEQTDSYPHKDTYESQVEGLKLTTQQLSEHVYSVTGSLHGVPASRKLSYTAQGVLRAEVLVGLLGAPRAGKLFATVPPFRHAEMISDLKKTSAQFFLLVPKVGKRTQLDEFYEVFPKRLLHDVASQPMHHMSDKRVPDLFGVVQTSKKVLNGMMHHSDFLAPHYPSELLRKPLSAEEISTLVLDGDSFAAFSQSNLINTANSLGAAIGLKDTVATLTAVSPSSAQGLTSGFMLPLVRRSKLVVASDDSANNVARLHEAIAQHGVQHVVADSAVWLSLLASSQPTQTKAFASSIKSALVVGDHTPIDPELIKSIKSTLGVPVVHTSNGSARSTGVSLVNGQAIANTQVKLVDQNGKDSTSSGFVAVKGISVFKGYYDNGAVDTKTIKDGWVTTNIKATQTAPNTFNVTN